MEACSMAASLCYILTEIKREPFGFKSLAGVATGLSMPALYLVKGQAAH